MTVPARWVSPDGTIMPCSFPGCTSDVKVAGLCGPHYYRSRVHKSDANRGWYNSDGSRMSCERCELPVEARGLCRMHYREVLADVDVPKRPRSKWVNPDGSRMVCRERECGEPVRIAGLCGLHYDRDRRKRVSTVSGADRVCPVSGCGRKKIPSASLCGRCRQARWRYGLTDEQFEEMMLPQNRKCHNPGCGVDNVELHLDHDHSCCPPGKFESRTRLSCGSCVRGWLCRPCNVSLGMLQESPRRIEGLLEYLNGVRR